MSHYWLWDKKQHESTLQPGVMAGALQLEVLGSPLVFWLSLLMIFAGFSMHRMGPSFSRGRFGLPIACIGVVLLFSPSPDSAHPEAAVIDSLASSINWIVFAISGTYLIVGASPTYGVSKPTSIGVGWILVISSWYFATPLLLSLEIDLALEGIAGIFGFLTGLLAFTLGIWIAERRSSIAGESKPLSEDEVQLVKSILVRRIGSEMDDN